MIPLQRERRLVPSSKLVRALFLHRSHHFRTGPESVTNPLERSTEGAKMSVAKSITLLSALALFSAGLAPQPPAVKLQKQIRDGAALQPMSDAELAELGDPLFSLLLRDHADKIVLADIEKLIQPDEQQRQIFVV